MQLPREKPVWPLINESEFHDPIQRPKGCVELDVSAIGPHTLHPETEFWPSENTIDFAALQFMDKLFCYSPALAAVSIWETDGTNDSNSL